MPLLLHCTTSSGFGGSAIEGVVVATLNVPKTSSVEGAFVTTSCIVSVNGRLSFVVGAVVVVGSAAPAFVVEALVERLQPQIT